MLVAHRSQHALTFMFRYCKLSVRGAINLPPLSSPRLSACLRWSLRADNLKRHSLESLNEDKYNNLDKDESAITEKSLKPSDLPVRIANTSRTGAVRMATGSRI